jgi:hypothetical protein
MLMAYAKRTSEDLGGTPLSASRPRFKTHLEDDDTASDEDDDSIPSVPGMEPHMVINLMNTIVQRVIKGQFIVREVATAMGELSRDVRQDIGEETERAVASLRVEVQTLREKNGALEEEVGILKSRLDRFQAEGPASVRDTISALKTQLQEMDAKVVQMQSEKGNKAKDVKDVREALKKYQGIVAGCENQICELGCKIQGMGDIGDVQAIKIQMQELLRVSEKREAEAARSPSPVQGNYAEALKTQMQTMEQKLCTVQKLQQEVNARDEKDSLHRTFKVVGRYPAGNSLGARLRAVLEPLDMAGVSMDIVKGLKGRGDHDGPILFRIRHAQDAEQLRRMRTKLKGKGYAIVDELSNTEYEAFKKLKPQFDDARKAGKPTWWNRARLFVEGKEVKPPCDQASGGDPMQEAA